MTDSGRTEPSERMRSYCRSNPLAYAGFRIIHIQSGGKNDTIAERDEIPFITSLFFPLLITGFTLLKRVLYVAGSVLGRRDDVTLPNDGHLFVMTSAAKYRTHTFVEVAQVLKERDYEVLLLCSPDAMKEQDRFREAGLEIIEITEAVENVRIHMIPLLFVKTVATVRTLLDITEYSHESVSRLLLFNLVYLEAIKTESLRTVTANDPVIHTFSPMPYQMESTGFDRLFMYQHGIQWDKIGVKDFTTPCPPFAPITYLIWGEIWRERFEAYSHPDSTIITVGSPWYDHLAERAASRSDPEWDVLFVAKAPARDEVKTRQYESLVQTVVDTCEAQGYSLAIKLHPMEDSSWYTDRGFDGYVESFEDIDDALLSCRIAITNTSSAFVESAVLGTPMIVADAYERELGADLGPMENVAFPDSTHEIPNLIADALASGSERIREGPQPMEVGQSTERIVEAVLERI